MVPLEWFHVSCTILMWKPHRAPHGILQSLVGTPVGRNGDVAVKLAVQVESSWRLHGPLVYQHVETNWTLQDNHIWTCGITHLSEINCIYQIFLEVI